MRLRNELEVVSPRYRSVSLPALRAKILRSIALISTVGAGASSALSLEIARGTANVNAASV